uniref:Diguanylate cyclase/phosphodiesterase with GAF sensor n=1 Tax=Leptospirillum ferrodiazotrophum TaxID=412449 RepID=C6HUQ1_9BACT|nr:MAG: diguanylate cyclase/phosphodiesterase with GAF sensor [Leptospirillum ferrodiazotrophum]
MNPEMTDREEITRAVLHSNRLLVRSVGAPLDATLESLCSILVEELSARLVVISRLDLEDLSLRPVAAEGAAREYLDGIVLSASSDSPMGQGPAGQVMRSGSPMVAKLPDSLPPVMGLHDRVRRFDLGGSALAPIYTSEGLWGLISVYRSSQASFSSDILPLLQSFARDIGDFLDRRREFQELSLRRSFQEAIESFQSRLLQGLSVDEIRSALLECVVDRMAFPAAFLVEESRENPPSRTPPRLAGYRLSSGAFPGIREDFSDELVGKVFSQALLESPLPEMPVGENFLFGPSESPLWTPMLRKVFEDLSLGGAIFFSLEVLEDPPKTLSLLIGVRSFHPPSQETVELLSQLVNGTRMAMAQSRDRSRLDLYARFYRAIGAIGKLLARHPAPQDLYDGVCDALVEATGIDLAFVSLLEPGDKVRVVSARGRARDFIDGAVFSVDPQDPGRCLIHSRTLGTSDVVEFPLLEEWLCSDAVREVARPWHLRNTLTVSFAKDGHRIGILGLISREKGFFDRTLVGLLGGIAQDISFSLEFLDRQERLKVLASIDPLTDLPNRTAFVGELGRLTSSQPDLALSVGILDIDGFKNWNDAFGHIEGDRLLQSMAREIPGILPKGAFLARMGGDEFGICLSSPGSIDRRRVEEISQKILDLGLRLDGGHNLVTVSLGWALFPDDAKTPAELLARADESLFAAKSSGRNRSTLFGPEIAQAMVSRVETRRSFPLALERGEILFWLQPQVDVRGGRVEGVEMLVRWKREEGMVPPGTFIPEVEREPALIRKLGCHALSEACRLRRELSAPLPTLRISLNIGAGHFLHPAFLDDVDAALRGETGTGLVVEVTEGASLESPERTGRIREELRRRGLELSLDDFGTGFSSLHHVADLLPDEIKLDGSFMRSFRMRTNAFAVVGSTLLLTDLSGSRLVGEGIEHRSDVELWLRMGGSLVQGYFFAKPMSLDDFKDFYARPLPEIALPPVYPVEELPFLEYAFRTAGEASGDSGGLPGLSCPLDSWFEVRGVHYYHLPSWHAAREAHQAFHRGGGTRGAAEVAPLEAPLQALREEIDAYLQALPLRP